MRVAVVSDVHSNWPALEAVMADFQDVDDVICLGDVVGYGADAVRCLDHVRASGWLTLTGNHDLACTEDEVRDWFNADAAAAIEWTVEQLGADRLSWLAQLPQRGSREGVQLVHASLRSPVFEYILDEATAAANLRLLQPPGGSEGPGGVCFHGHTHLPGVFTWAGGRVVHTYDLGSLAVTGPGLYNPGSVGQPRDRNPDASYAIWDTEAATFEFRRVAYDREAAKRAIVKAGLPTRFAARLDFGY